MSPELKLVAACCRWPQDAVGLRMVADAAEGVDWDRFAGLTSAHRVEGLVWRALDGAGVRVPETVAGRLQAMANAVHAASIRSIGETLRICSALDDAAIDYRIIKGLPVAAIAYGNIAIKNSIDIDLLVRPPDAVRTAQLLSGLGYSCVHPTRRFDERRFNVLEAVAKEACFVSDRGQVDLHWQLVDQRGLLQGLDPWSNPRLVDLLNSGHPVRTLPDSANLAYLAAHGAASGWSRLKWVADFAAFLGNRPESERIALCDSARLMCGTRVMDQALMLVERLLGTGIVPRPSPADRKAVERLVALAMTIIEARSPVDVLENGWRARLAISRSWWSLRSGFGYRVGELGRALRRQEVHLRLRWPLPKRLHWLYRLAGPLGFAAGLVAFVCRAGATKINRDQ